MTRFLVGIVFDAVLVIGGAYVRDTGMIRSAPPPQTLVNWDLVFQALGGR